MMVLILRDRELSQVAQLTTTMAILWCGVDLPMVVSVPASSNDSNPTNIAEDRPSKVDISPDPKRPRLLTRLDNEQAVDSYIRDLSAASSSSHH